MDHPLGKPSEIPALLRQHGLFPDKRLGQNFLVDSAALEKILATASITSKDIILEIGAGIGNLTRLLASQAQFVVAVELDGRLIPVLQDVLKDFANVRIIEGDILSLDIGNVLNNLRSEPVDYTVVANIPYYITSAVVRHLLEASIRPHKMILTVQREVAERICAKPGEYSMLALSVQVYGNPHIAAHIPAGAFYPLPKVDSAVICVNTYPTPLISLEQLDTFFRIAKAGFSQKRKTLRNALASSLGLAPQQVEKILLSVPINPMRRAETLDLEEWSQLTSLFHAIQMKGS